MPRRAVIVVVALSAGSAWSQEVAIVPLAVGESKVVRMERNQRIKVVHGSDSKVCRVSPIQIDPSAITVTGLLSGRSRLTLVDLNDKSELVDVVVYEQSKKTAAPLRPGETEISLLDGSVVRVAALFEKIDIVTAYGPLSIPREDIRAIEFGLHMPDGAGKQIQSAIRALGSTDARERDRAGKTLIDLGPFSYAAVCEAAVVDDLEVSQRALRLAKELEANHSRHDLKVAVKDRIVTAESTIVGVIQTRNLKARSPWLGELNLSVAGMRALRAEETAKK
jgi:hypothetical protein